METTSLLPFAFMGVAQIDEEHEQIWHQFVNLGAQISRGEFVGASETGGRLQVEIEAHFAFEELAMARTGDPRARSHSTDHAAQLSALAQLVRHLRGCASERLQDEGGKELLARLLRMRRRLERHMAGLDLALKRHMESAAARRGFPSLPTAAPEDGRYPIRKRPWSDCASVQRSIAKGEGCSR